MIEKLLGELFEHADLIGELLDAIKTGSPKDALRALIRQAKIDASDKALEEELKNV